MPFLESRNILIKSVTPKVSSRLSISRSSFVCRKKIINQVCSTFFNSVARVRLHPFVASLYLSISANHTAAIFCNQTFTKHWQQNCRIQNCQSNVPPLASFSLLGRMPLCCPHCPERLSQGYAVKGWVACCRHNRKCLFGTVAKLSAPVKCCKGTAHRVCFRPPIRLLSKKSKNFFRSDANLKIPK